MQKFKIALSYLGMLTLVAYGAACTGGDHSDHKSDVAASPTIDHSKMDHGTIPAMDHSSMASSPGAANAPYDLQFLDTMIAHHKGAVDMSKPAAAQAGSAEVKALAGAITAAQEKEIAQMRAWRDKWFPKAEPAINMEMEGMHDSMEDMDMTKLGSAKGADFDRLFAEMMIPHHEGAIVMAKEALKRSKYQEIRTLAEGIIKSQSYEIKKMQNWLKK
jgi:uncharacterized protein (DUF305 family)